MKSESGFSLAIASQPFNIGSKVFILFALLSTLIYCSYVHIFYWRKLKSSSSPAFSSGVFFKGAEDNGGNSIGGKLNRKSSLLEVIWTKTWFFPRTLPSGAHVLQRGVDQGERGKAKKAGQGDSNCWWQMSSKVAQKGINLLGTIWANFATVNVSKQPLLLV